MRSMVEGARHGRCAIAASPNMPPPVGRRRKKQTVGYRPRLCRSASLSGLPIADIGESVQV
jgi:hypothetical protein